MSFNICERETSYCLIRSPYRPPIVYETTYICEYDVQLIIKVEKTRIEPVGKSYREVCLQTKW